jgi:putative ABC transport system permease protein
MSRLLDEHGETVTPKGRGVLLSRYFEKQFGLRLGSRVMFQTLDGRERKFFAAVDGFVDDFIGQQAYALRADLNRWLDEFETINVAQLRIDPQAAEKIYVHLKERPGVATVTVRRLLLSSFNELVGEMIVTFTAILVGFAVAIASAVIFNSVRINFSERGWELASLRILGWSVFSTFELLFLEIGWQVMLSLPFGLWLGHELCQLSTQLIHNETFNFPLVIDLSTYGGSMLLLMLTFIGSSIYIFRKVQRLDFSQALKARD